MSPPTHSAETPFATEFLQHYLRNGMGSMSKTDIDALVMHLLDLYASENGRPLGGFPNQVASERLRTPLNRIKRLRYEAGLKYGLRPEDEARRRFVVHLAKAGLELDKKDGSVTKIVFAIEDILARNWIQGQIKEHNGLFDTSFNTEIVKVEPDLFFRLLRTVLEKDDVDSFERKYAALLTKHKREGLQTAFKALVASFATGAAEAGGALTVHALLQLPIAGA